MGTGIGLVAARKAQLNVHLVDTTEEKLAASRAFAETLLKKDVDRGRMTTEERYDVLGRMSYGI
jgi:3-hydroxyacyl-CoA dehydrogenase